jgi:hypothetical protein
MRSRKTVPVSERALIQRINRALRGNGEMLKAARSLRVADEIGQHFVVRITGKRNNIVTQRHVDVEALGRELGALSDWEHLEQDLHRRKA